MAIPDYQTLMLPLLKSLDDNQPHSMRELFESLSTQFNLNDEDMSERVPSGRETKIKNRISWARTYLKKAGLVASPAKGQVKITDVGSETLREPGLQKIDNVYLRKFPSFVEFRPRSTDPESQEKTVEITLPEITPEEQFGEAYKDLQSNLISDVLDAVKSSTPSFFEQLVIDLMLAIGYGGNFKNAGVATPASRDNGIDGIINEDKLGLDSIYLQAKRWDKVVDRPEIDKFIGALTRQGARKGVFITTSGFSAGSREASIGLNISIVLIDGKELAHLMVEHDVGVATKDIFKIKQVDSDYFED